MWRTRWILLGKAVSTSLHCAESGVSVWNRVMGCTVPRAFLHHRRLDHLLLPDSLSSSGIILLQSNASYDVTCDVAIPQTSCDTGISIFPLFLVLMLQYFLFQLIICVPMGRDNTRYTERAAYSSRSNFSAQFFSSAHPRRSYALCSHSKNPYPYLDFTSLRATFMLSSTIKR